MTVENTPTLANALLGFFQGQCSGMYTSMPGRVETYDASTLKASVKPLIQRTYADESGEFQSESLPVIDSVPVLFQGAGGMRITFPVAKGDIVLLMFANNSLDRWLAIGGEVEPQDERRFALSDAVAIPGLSDFKNAKSADASALVLEGSDIRLGSPSATDPLVTKSVLDAAFAKYDLHVHTQVTSLGVPTVPTGFTVGALTGTTKVTAE